MVLCNLVAFLKVFITYIFYLRKLKEQLQSYSQSPLFLLALYREKLEPCQGSYQIR